MPDKWWKCYTAKSLAQAWGAPEAELAADMVDLPYLEVAGERPSYPYWAIYGVPKPLLTQAQALGRPGVMPAHWTLSEFWFAALGPKQVAAYLDLDPGSVLRLLEAGTIPGLKIGQAWGVLPDWVICYLHENVKTMSGRLGQVNA